MKKVTAINDIANTALKQKLVSVNFDDYMKKKINTKNMMHSIIICMIAIFGTLIMLFDAYTKDPETWVLIANPLMVCSLLFKICDLYIARVFKYLLHKVFKANAFFLNKS